VKNGWIALSIFRTSKYISNPSCGMICCPIVRDSGFHVPARLSTDDDLWYDGDMSLTWALFGIFVSVYIPKSFRGIAYSQRISRYCQPWKPFFELDMLDPALLFSGRALKS
jgi:hypothetical protein